MTNSDTPAPQEVLQADRLPIKYNATKHGILSPLPVVTAFETVVDWEQHRNAIIESLDPAPGMEEMLAERVALLSWRLNRVIMYEVARIQQRQDAALDYVRRSRATTLKYPVSDRNEALRLVEGTEMGEIMARGGSLSDIGVRLGSDPLLQVVRLEEYQAHFAAVGRVSKAIDRVWKGESGETIPGGVVSHALFEAAETALDLALALRDEGMPKKAKEKRAGELARELYERLGENEDYAAEEVLALLEWLAEEVNLPGEGEHPPVERLLERMHFLTCEELKKQEQRADEALQAIQEAREDRMLPEPEDLDKIPRYEAHLSRQMYQALHELEALQARRKGGAAPLARIDVSGVGEN
jgi:hypothetical protein